MRTYELKARDRLLGGGLVPLGAAVAVVAVMGPLVLDVLTVVAPVSIAMGVSTEGIR